LTPVFLKSFSMSSTHLFLGFLLLLPPLEYLVALSLVLYDLPFCLQMVSSLLLIWI
jgi:hypothetical protein